MTKLIVVLLFTLAFPMASLAWDTDDALRENIRQSEQNQRNYNQQRRENINDNMGRALNDGDMDEARYQQQQMDRQIQQEKIRNPFGDR
jgi:hypothetical protein